MDNLFSQEALRVACGKKTLIEVSDTEKTLRILDEKGIARETRDARIIEIKEKMSASEIFRALDAEKIEIFSMEADGDLETYFIDLIKREDKAAAKRNFSIDGKDKPNA